MSFRLHIQGFRFSDYIHLRDWGCVTSATHNASCYDDLKVISLADLKKSPVEGAHPQVTTHCLRRVLGSSWLILGVYG